jgi:hypothetical protein
MREGEWIALPLGAAGARMVYRKSWVNEAGFEEFPTDTQQILECAKKLHANGHPLGMALGHAVGDGNGWTHAILWGFGAKMVDDDNKVVINSPETLAALEYVKELYQYFIPGTLSWLDSNNNKAFLAGELGATNNGISVYYAAKTSEDAAVKAMAEDIYHQQMPVGPIGHPTELHLCTQAGMAERLARLRRPPARRLQGQCGVARRPEGAALPGRCQEHALQRLFRPARLLLGGGDGRLYRGRHVRLGLLRRRDTAGCGRRRGEARQPLLPGLAAAIAGAIFLPRMASARR